MALPARLYIGTLRSCLQDTPQSDSTQTERLQHNPTLALVLWTPLESSSRRGFRQTFRTSEACPVCQESMPGRDGSDSQAITWPRTQSHRFPSISATEPTSTSGLSGLTRQRSLPSTRGSYST